MGRRPTTRMGNLSPTSMKSRREPIMPSQDARPIKPPLKAPLPHDLRTLELAVGEKRSWSKTQRRSTDTPATVSMKGTLSGFFDEMNAERTSSVAEAVPIAAYRPSEEFMRVQSASFVAHVWRPKRAREVTETQRRRCLEQPGYTNEFGAYRSTCAICNKR